MPIDLYTLTGLVGAGVVVVAYFANQVGRLDSADWRFPAANLVGSVMILVSLYVEWNLPAVVIELFWSAISIYGFVRSRRPDRKPG